MRILWSAYFALGAYNSLRPHSITTISITVANLSRLVLFSVFSLSLSGTRTIHESAPSYWFQILLVSLELATIYTCWSSWLCSQSLTRGGCGEFEQALRYTVMCYRQPAKFYAEVLAYSQYLLVNLCWILRLIQHLVFNLVKHQISVMNSALNVWEA